MAWPANNAGHAKATFEGGPFTAGKRGLPTIRPGEVLRAIVSREDDDRVVIQTVVFKMCKDCAYDVVKLCHPGFLDAPAVLRCSHRLVFLGEMGDHMHACGVEPDEERLVRLLR